MGITVVIFAIIVVAGLGGMTWLLLRGMERVPIESIKAHAQAGRGGVSVGLEVRAHDRRRRIRTASPAPLVFRSYAAAAAQARA
jgi:Na+/citrate or Na+/malate symporter